ncbi:hypothetical protein SAV31267_002570 [Streptomyces avermitilis]|uniref:Uncharacterized protein n=1 Tax=Streptomyces avermitilis TaxID=33903 RepID=A0A4D4MFK1_STRAX|nr:hypothetical protein SAV31267_002570 [Streptomyces avermitilis]
MQMHLRTRGTPRGLDYGFINSAPGTRWWDAYSDWIATERPCLLAVAEDGQEHWRVLLSGIPSARTDSGGRLIYYTLVLEGAYDTAEENEAVVLSLASHLLADLAADEQSRGELSGLLDGLCPAEEVDALLAAPAEHTADRAALTDRLLTAITALEPVRYEAPPGTPTGGSPDGRPRGRGGLPHPAVGPALRHGTGAGASAQPGLRGGGRGRPVPGTTRGPG